MTLQITHFHLGNIVNKLKSLVSSAGSRSERDWDVVPALPPGEHDANFQSNHQKLVMCHSCHRVSAAQCLLWSVLDVRVDGPAIWGVSQQEPCWCVCVIWRAKEANRCKTRAHQEKEEHSLFGLISYYQKQNSPSSFSQILLFTANLYTTVWKEA